MNYSKTDIGLQSITTLQVDTVFFLLFLLLLRYSFFSSVEGTEKISKPFRCQNDRSTTIANPDSILLRKRFLGLAYLRRRYAKTVNLTVFPVFTSFFFFFDVIRIVCCRLLQLHSTKKLLLLYFVSNQTLTRFLFRDLRFFFLPKFPMSQYLIVLLFAIW